jgi:hypothetical protein
MPNMKQSKETNFIVHWMNNKDFNFTYAAELFSHEIHEKLRRAKSGKSSKESSVNEFADETLTETQCNYCFYSFCKNHLC